MIKKQLNNGKKDSRQGRDSVIEELKRNRIDVADDRFKELVNEHREMLFEKDTLYERTREKLIGLTIHFDSNVEEAYEDIAHQVVSGDFEKYLIRYKDSIVSTFDKASHKNLRTLISVIIAAESIISLLKPEISSELNEQCDELNINIDEIVEIEKQRILFYIVKTAIQKA